MPVPYGDPRPAYFRCNAFDIGEYGTGMLANSREQGCDCLGDIHDFDVAGARQQWAANHVTGRDLPPRRGLRPALEARRLANRVHRGTSIGAAVHRDRWLARVRIVLVLLPGCQPPTGGETDRRHFKRCGATRRGGAVGRTRRAAGVRTDPPAPSPGPAAQGTELARRDRAVRRVRVSAVRDGAKAERPAGSGSSSRPGARRCLSPVTATSCRAWQSPTSMAA